MFNLGKKLSSVLLCGSMAVTLLGNSGVHAANEVTEAIEDKSKEKVTAVDEHGNKFENDDEKNEDAEVDTNNEYQYVEKEDIPAQNLAKRAGSSFAVDVAKGLSTAALGVGVGEGVRRIRKGSSGSEEVSKEGTKIGVRELQKKLDDTEIEARELQKKLEGAKIGVRELQKKLEEDEKIYNFAYGAIGGLGYIPQLRDMVSSKLGRDIDVKSKAAIRGMLIFHTIGLFLFLWNLVKLCNEATKPNSIKGGLYTAVKMLTDLSLPPVGLILGIVEMVINEFKRLGVNNVNMIEDAYNELYDDVMKKNQ